MDFPTVSEEGDGSFRVLRKLDGITYWVIEDPEEIRELVCDNIRMEWEADIAEQKDHEEGAWLGTIQARDWRLKVVGLDEIKLSMDIMNYTNEETGYNFRKRLEERKKILERDIDRFGAVIRPLVLRAEDMQLLDGYCRYHVISDRRVAKAFAYLGSLPSR
jgi:hypothetical protein